MSGGAAPRALAARILDAVLHQGRSLKAELGAHLPTLPDPRDRALVEFVKRMSEISRGKAYFTNTMTLGQFILMDFLKKKTSKVT